MPINIGTSGIDSLSVGTSGINRVYSGSDLVFNSYNAFPAVYTFNAGALINTSVTQLPLDSASNDNYTISSGSLVPDTSGWYYITYSVWIESFSGSNRSEVQAGIRVDGNIVEQSKSSGYIRRSASEEDVLSASFPVFLDASADVDLIAVRTDSNSALVNSKPFGVGLTICKLPDSVEVLTVSGGYQANTGSTNTTPLTNLQVSDIHAANGTAYTGLSATVESQGSELTLSSNSIVVNSNGYYLVGYSVKTNNITTNTRYTITTYLSENGSPRYNQAYGYCYNRGLDGVNDGICAGVGLLNLNADDAISLYVAESGELVNSAHQNIPEAYLWMIKIRDEAVDLDLEGVGTTRSGYGVTPAQNVVSGTLAADDNYIFVYNLEHNRTTVNVDRKTPAAQVNVAGASTGGLNACFHRGDQSTTGTFWGGTSGSVVNPGASGGDPAALMVRDIEVTSGFDIQTPGETSYLGGIRLSLIG